MAHKFKIPFSFCLKNWIKLKHDGPYRCLTHKFPKSSPISTLIAVATITKNSTLDMPEHVTINADFSHRKLIQQACSNSTNSTSELLTQILLAVMDSASKYKNSLDILMENLEKNDELCIYGAVNQTTEDDIMEARNQAQIFKEEFWELVTMSEHVEKLATATSEVSFLIGAETLAMVVAERLYSIQQKIRNEIEDVRRKENEYLELQKTIIEKEKEDNS